MDELDKNLKEVIDQATKNGEKVVTIECPSCHKTFYATVSEAAYSVLNRNEETDFGMDLKKFYGQQLGRKCPFCGFACGLTSSDFLKLGRDSFIQDEINAEVVGKNTNAQIETSWADLNNIKINFED